MSSDGLRIGVVGVGRIGAFHARTLAAHEAVSSVVLADTDMSRANSLAGKLGIETAATAEALAAFATTVRNGGPSLCSLQDARAALVVALAADRSRAEHRPVSTREIVFSEEVAPT